MPRKRISGRSRRADITSNIYVQAEKINRRIRSLEKGGNYGKYKGKELIQFAKNYSSYLSLRKGRGSKRARLRIKNLKEATMGQLRVITKKFRETIKAKGFSNIGIKDIRAKTREEVKKTLSGATSKDLTDKEVDLFFEIIKYKTDEIISKIGPSQFYVITMQAIDENADLNRWYSLLSSYITINNKEIQKACEYLYNKFVA